MKNRISIILSILALFSLLISCGGGGGGGGGGAVVSSSGGSTNPPVGTGSVTLTWDEVTENTDNTQLTDLSGYVIYYDTESKNSNESYTYSVNLDINSLSDTANPTTEVSSLTPGTWYFRVSAYNSIGNESGKSDQINITVL